MPVTITDSFTEEYSITGIVGGEISTSLDNIGAFKYNEGITVGSKTTAVFSDAVTYHIAPGQVFDYYWAPSWQHRTGMASQWDGRGYVADVPWYADIYTPVISGGMFPSAN